MSLLFRIVYAAHADGTHHKLALDGLAGLQMANAEAWRRLFLKHAERFMEGAKAPDTRFKDFKNHVLHVSDGYWGGAPELAETWYGSVVAGLRTARWGDAVYAAGVLSHYYTDPIMPFHTGQTEAENAIHAAAEWSINRSYDDLRKLGLQAHPSLEVKAEPGEAWLKAMVLAGAERAHRHYEKLIAHYDIHAGVVDPPAGLDAIARAIVGELLVYAASGFACILEQAIGEAAIAPPEVSLTLDTVMAAVKIPAKALAKRLSNAADRAAVAAMYDELKATGRVEATLREDDRAVRDLHAHEVLAPRQAALAEARTARLSAIVPPVAKAGQAAHRGLRAVDAMPPVESAPALARGGDGRAAEPAPEGPARALSAPSSRVPQMRTFLAPTDDIEAAPSIGPKMAERLGALGLRSVADLLSASAEVVAEGLADRRIGADVILAWQQQARLVMDIPGLRGGHAQLLTGAGYATALAIAGAEVGKLCADVLAFAATAEGHRILRDGNPPDVERIRSWAEAASAKASAA